MTAVFGGFRILDGNRTGGALEGEALEEDDLLCENARSPVPRPKMAMHARIISLRYDILLLRKDARTVTVEKLGYGTSYPIIRHVLAKFKSEGDYFCEPATVKVCLGGRVCL